VSGGVDFGAPASDPAAELATIASVLLDPSSFGIAAETLPGGDFFDGRHRAIWTALRRIHARGETIELVGLRAELQATGTLERAGGDDHLVRLTGEIPVGDLGAYIRIVRRLASVRAVRDAALRVLAITGEPVDDVERLLEEAEASIATVVAARRSKRSTSRTSTFGELVAETAARAEAGRLEPTVTTGIPDLDAAIVGYVRNDLVLIGADTNAGKSTTALVTGIAQVDAGERVAVISVEDPRSRWRGRSAWIASGVPILDMARGLNRAQIAALVDAAERVRDVDLKIWHVDGGSKGDVMLAVVEAIAWGATIVKIDYLTAIAGGSGDAYRHFLREVVENLREILGRSPSVTLELLSQLREREDETRRPSKNDISESKAVVQKADSVLLLWADKDRTRRWYLDKSKSGHKAEGPLVIWRGKFKATTSSSSKQIPMSAVGAEAFQDE
jgi:replicative DNA helicase